MRMLAPTVAVLISVLASLPSPASAQAQAVPRYRLDVDAFTPGGFLVVRERDGSAEPYVDGFLSGQVGVRLAFANGSGLYLDPSFSMALTGPLFALVETGYLHRLRLTGDDARGVGIDLELGASIGHQSSDWARNLDEGLVGGPNAGVSLDYREGAFVVGLLVRYRALYDGLGISHMISATIRIGVGTWD